MSRFASWLADTQACEGALTWCHTTDAYSLQQIIESGQCSLNSCDVFHEELLYFFYGRPAFRAKQEKLSKAGVSPVVLMFDTDIVAQGKRMFPFDSGAFHDNRYENQMYHKMTVDDFLLECSSESPRKHVSALFETNRNYVKTKVRENIKDYSGVFEVMALVRVLRDPPEGDTDDRRMAVELQLPVPLAVAPGRLKAVIYPDEIERAKWLIQFKKLCAGDVLFRDYEMHAGKLTSAYDALLEAEATRIQEELGLL